MFAEGGRALTLLFNSVCNSLTHLPASPTDRRLFLKSEKNTASGSSLADATSWWEGSRSPGQVESGEMALISDEYEDTMRSVQHKHKQLLFPHGSLYCTVAHLPYSLKYEALNGKIHLS
jgi:hypothetical protein